MAWINTNRYLFLFIFIKLVLYIVAVVASQL